MKVGMAAPPTWPSTAGPNMNVGPPLPPPPRRLKLPAGGTILLVRPRLPFAAPTCHRHGRARWIGWQKHRWRFWLWNVYRCRTCAMAMWPERFYHRALPWLFPF